MYSLPFFRFKVTVKALETGTMPTYAGPLLYNEMKKVLYNQVCVEPNTACSVCPYREGCRYALFFDEPSTFIVHGPSFPSKKWIAKEEKTFTVTVFQRAYKGLVSILDTLFVIEKQGVGKEYIPFQLTSIEQQIGKQTIPVLEEASFLDDLVQQSAFELPTMTRLPKVVRVILETPLQMEENTELNDTTFFSLCSERIQQLFPEITLYMQGSGHYHVKQLQNQLFIGTISFENITEETLDALLIVEQVHIGKQTACGYGKIAVWMKYF